MSDRQIVYFEELSSMIGSGQGATVKRRLEEQGIKVFTGIGSKKLWTTIGLIEAAGGIKRKEPAQESRAQDYI